MITTHQNTGFEATGDAVFSDEPFESPEQIRQRLYKVAYNTNRDANYTRGPPQNETIENPQVQHPSHLLRS